MSIESQRFCEECLKYDIPRNSGLSQPEDITAFYDIRYCDRSDYNTLDVYYPVGTSSKLPTILNIHGGGYVYGDAKLYMFYCMSLAQRGFAVVNFNYGLAPDYQFPTPLEDINIALEWIVKNAEEYFLDVDNVFLVGDSAGAQLASQFGVIYSNLEYAGLFGISVPNVKIRALGLNCGMYDLAVLVPKMDKNDFKIKDYFTSDYERFGALLDPLSYLNKSYPPSYLLTAGNDFLKHHCKPMADFINSKGSYAEWKIYGDENFGHVFHVNIKKELANIANDEQCDFFKRHIVR